MNWNAQPNKAESVAYINKNVDTDDPRTNELAEGMLKAIKDVMNDMKAQGLLFQDEVNGKTVTAKAVVKVAPALDKEHGEQVIVNGKKQMSYPQKMNDNGEPIFNVSATIYHGMQNLTIFGGQKVNEETGKVDLTSMRWSHYNRNNPQNSPSAKGNAEIQASKASSELKAIAQAIEDFGYLRDLDVALSEKKVDKDDKDALAVAQAMRNTVKPLVQDMKEKHMMPELTSQSGKTYYGKAFIEVQPKMAKDENGKYTDKQAFSEDGKPQYWVKAGIRKDNDTLYLVGGSAIREDNTVSIYGMQFQSYNPDSPADSIRVKQEDIQTSNDVPNEFKRLAQAIEDGGYISEYNRSEMRQFAYHLNTEVFKTKVEVEHTNDDGTTEMVEKKLVNANYTPERDREDGKEGTYAEQITLFNKAEPEVLVALSESENYGKSAKAINTALTQVEVGTNDEGKPIYDVVEKTDPSDRAAAFYLNTAEDVANFCPNIPELHEAISEWTGIDIEQIKDAIENLEVEDVDVENIKESGKVVEVDGFDSGQIDDLGGLEDFEEIGDIDDLPFE